MPLACVKCGFTASCGKSILTHIDVCLHTFTSYCAYALNVLLNVISTFFGYCLGSFIPRNNSRAVHVPAGEPFASCRACLPWGSRSIKPTNSRHELISPGGPDNVYAMRGRGAHGSKADGYRTWSKLVLCLCVVFFRVKQDILCPEWSFHHE